MHLCIYMFYIKCIIILCSRGLRFLGLIDVSRVLFAEYRVGDMTKTVMNIRIVVEENIDKSSPWGYFDGSVVGVPQLCGVGGLLYINDDHYVTFKVGLGSGTNNLAEIFSLKLLLTLALEKQISNMQIFGDS